MTLGNVTSRTFATKASTLSFLAAIAICCIHVPWPVDSAGAKLFFSARLHAGALALCFFYLLSGCFIARQARRPDWWWQTVRSDAVRWLVPYFALPAVCVALIALLHFDPGYLRSASPLLLFGLKPCRDPYLYPFWFLRTLFLFVLASPVVVKALSFKRGIPFLSLTLACAICFIANVAPQPWRATVETTRLYGFFYYTFNVIGFFFFSVGVYLGQRPLPSPSSCAIRLCGIAALPLVTLQVVLTLFSTFESGCWDILAALLAAPFLLVYVWFRMPQWKLPRILRGTAFPIYLLHLVVIKAYCSFRPEKDLGFAECLLLFILASGIPVFVGKPLRQMARGFRLTATRRSRRPLPSP